MFDNVTKIIDVTGDKPIEMKGYVPERSVVIPEVIPNNFLPENIRCLVL
jgi:hypothetical protein